MSSENEMYKYAVLSSISYDVYKHDLTTAEENLETYLPQHQMDKDLTDDYSSVFYHPESNEVVIAYRGTAGLKDVAATWIPIALGNPLSKHGAPVGYYQFAFDKFNDVKKKYPDATITTTGHSLGGSEAYIVGKRNNVKSYIFNAGSSPLDVATDIGGIEHNEQNKSTHYYVPGDIVGASRAIYDRYDTLVPVKSFRWLTDLAKSIGVGAIVGMLAGPFAGGVALTGAEGFGIVSEHGLENFLPEKAFHLEEELKPTHTAYKFVKPHYDRVIAAQRPQTRARVVSFDNPPNINMKEFIKNCVNPYDPKCKNKL